MRRPRFLALKLGGALAFAAAWLLPWRPVYRAPAASGLGFYAHRRDVIGRHIAKYGAHEPELTAWISKWLAAAPPGIVVDAGANIGWHTLHAARSPNVETVVAFEPDPFNAALLDRNRVANRIDNIVLVVAALGARRGTLRLHRYKASNLGRHSAVSDHALGSTTVPLLDLDSALEWLGMADKPVLLLKIDVEGYEPAVIEGAERTLARTRALVLEFQPIAYARADLAVGDMVKRLETAGFSPFLLGEEGMLNRVDVGEYLQREGYFDLIWLKQ